MNKEVQEAIKKLKEMKENCRYETYVPNEERDEWKRERKAIDTVLNELDNRNKRIYKLENDIEFIINKIVDKAKIYQYYTEITAGTNIETNIRQRTLTELLEEIKKEI